MKLKWIALALIPATMGQANAGPISTQTGWEYETTLTSGPVAFNWNAPSTSTAYSAFSPWIAGNTGNLTFGIPSTETGLVRVFTYENVVNPNFSATGQGAFSLGMTIKSPSGATGTLTFTGTLDLTITGGPNAWTDGAATFNQPTQSLTIGGNLYTVSMDFGMAIPGDPSAKFEGTPGPGAAYSATPGIFSAYVTQTPTAPEPGTLALAGFGIGILALISLPRFRIYDFFFPSQSDASGMLPGATGG
jgi:hypothetical protein